jgi:uncharacterized protein RhaS with RHS repeats
MYSPALGRFVQVDPIGSDGGINLYAYVFNDPLNLVDPLGLAADSALQSIGRAPRNLSKSWTRSCRLGNVRAACRLRRTNFWRGGEYGI